MIDYSSKVTIIFITNHTQLLISPSEKLVTQLNRSVRSCKILYNGYEYLLNHLLQEQNDIILGKIMAEEMLNNNMSNPLFLQYRDRVSNEAIKKWGVRQEPAPEINKFDWYCYPFESIFERAINKQQLNDIYQCTYNTYFSLVLSNTRYLLINKDKNYFGYESMASCWEPSIYSTKFFKISTTKTGTECWKDQLQENKYYYSILCRLWYMRQMASPNSK